MLIPITIGYDENKKIIKDLADLKHLFVYVSEEQMDFLLHSKRNALYKHFTSKEYQTITIDFSLKDQLNMSNTLKLIDDLDNERIKRMKYIEKEGCNNIDEYNATHNKKLKHIVLLMYGYPDDDYLGYFAINNILSMMTWSEGCGIHLLIITDDIYYIYDEIFYNFENRICTTNKIDTYKRVRRKTLFGITGFKLKENELVYYDRDSGKASILMYKPEDFIKSKRLQPTSKK